MTEQAERRNEVGLYPLLTAEEKRALVQELVRLAKEVPRLRLADQLEVLEAWQSYIEDEWISWSESCRRWERVQDAYRRLFSIYQMQRRRGEQFELVLGIGTLIWTTDSGQRVRRPIITGRAVIALEPLSGTITVSAPAEGANLRLEQDMLEVSERPPAADQQEYKRQVAGLDTPWDRPRIFEILRNWVQAAQGAGVESAGGIGSWFAQDHGHSQC